MKLRMLSGYFQPHRNIVFMKLQQVFLIGLAQVAFTNIPDEIVKLLLKIPISVPHENHLFLTLLNPARFLILKMQYNSPFWYRI
jgi:hypothetical protein